MWEKRSPHSRVPSTLQKLCQWFYLVPEKNTYMYLFYIPICRVSPRVLPQISICNSICHLHSLHRSHCNIDFDRVVLISDFYARISKNGCLNKTQTFPIIHILCISYKHILWSISFGFKFCGLQRKTGKQRIEDIVLHTLRSQ